MRTVGVKELTQNASRVLSDVEAYGEALITVAGRPVAVLSPAVDRQRWVSTAELLAAGAAQEQTEWLDELLTDRRDGDMTDPFPV